MMHIVDSEETIEDKLKPYGEWANREDKMEHLK